MKTAITEEVRLSRREGIIDAEMHGETVMFDPQSGRYFAMNETAGAIWSIIEAPATRTEVIAQLRRTFDLGQCEQVEAQISQFLEKMVESGFVVAEL